MIQISSMVYKYLILDGPANLKMGKSVPVHVKIGQPLLRVSYNKSNLGSCVWLATILRSGRFQVFAVILALITSAKEVMLFVHSFVCRCL